MNLHRKKCDTLAKGNLHTIVEFVWGHKCHKLEVNGSQAMRPIHANESGTMLGKHVPLEFCLQDEHKAVICYCLVMVSLGLVKYNRVVIFLPHLCNH